MSLSPLRADVFLAPAIPVISNPLPDNSTPLWTATTSTLVSSANSAVLVDPLLTTLQATSLADWIEDTYPNKTLTHVYVTHGHGDHFFGVSTILERFPGVDVVATAGTLAHMETQLTPAARTIWNNWFPGGQITFPASPPARALRAEDLTIDLEGHTLHAVPVGHSDTDDSSFLWVPDLKMAVAGDVVYNGAYSYMAESLTPALRQKWHDSIEKIKDYEPETVVVGHKLAGAVDGAWTLDATQDYIRLWDRLVGEAENATDMYEKVRKADPYKTGEFILWFSCQTQFPGNGTAVP